MPSWERCFSSLEQSLIRGERQLNLASWCTRGWKGQYAFTPCHRAKSDDTFLDGLERATGGIISSSLWVSWTSWGAGEVLHLSGWIYVTIILFCCDGSLSKEARLVITQSKGSFICGNKKGETLKINCHCTEVETVLNFCGAIVSSLYN